MNGLAAWLIVVRLTWRSSSCTSAFVPTSITVTPSAAFDKTSDVLPRAASSACSRRRSVG